MDAGFRTFDHTGDLGLEVWAPTPERLHELAAVALLAQVAEAGSDAAEERVRLDLVGEDPADLLVHWLNSALLAAELRRALWVRARIEAWSEHALTGTLEGPRLDPVRDVRLREIKAVSHHGLELHLEPPACRCRLVLDI